MVSLKIPVLIAVIRDGEGPACFEKEPVLTATKTSLKCPRSSLGMSSSVIRTAVVLWQPCWLVVKVITAGKMLIAKMTR